jgi:hypothetical protein
MSCYSYEGCSWPSDYSDWLKTTCPSSLWVWIPDRYFGFFCVRKLSSELMEHHASTRSAFSCLNTEGVLSPISWKVAYTVLRCYSVKPKTWQHLKLIRFFTNIIRFIIIIIYLLRICCARVTAPVQPNCTANSRTVCICCISNILSIVFKHIVYNFLVVPDTLTAAFWKHRK